jgi:mRNA interferase MazF
MAIGTTPDAGDVVWFPAADGLALVLSPGAYNNSTGLLICCPLTKQVKNYPFEVRLAEIPGTVALADQVNNLDWRARKAVRKGKASTSELAEVRAKIRALIGLSSAM